MRSFFRTLLACFIAVMAAGVVGFIFITMLVSVMSAALGESFTGGTTRTVGSGSVLRITLDESISDNPAEAPVSASFLTGSVHVNRQLSLLDAISAIEAAADDPRIEAVYLNINGYPSIGPASMGELREALDAFRLSGKPLISYADSYTQSAYYIGSVADRVYLNPAGDLEWRGMASRTLFFKGMLDKLGIRSEIVRHGRYKSAVEPFTEREMSPDSRLQTERLVGSVWGGIVAQIAASRSLDSAALQRYADSLSIDTPERAVELGLIDSLLYVDQMEEVIDSLIGPDYDVVDLIDYAALYSVPASAAGPRVEVIYAEGDIVDGYGRRDEVGGDRLSLELAEALDNDDIAAVVLRINSPGGSALASDVIARQTELLRGEKPVVVSMGDYAASGGYYIAAPADMICASPFTVTGSIGVFGLMFDIGDALESNLGITSSAVGSNLSADMGDMTRPLTDSERRYMQRAVDRTYDRFVGVVAKGRNLTVARVDSMAQGRVWSGTDASQIGLVDVCCGLKGAIALAAESAGVYDDFTVTTQRPSQSRINMFIELLGQEVSVSDDPLVGLAAKMSQRIRNVVRDNDKVMALMPLELILR
ncbi:MAG: signal peptide peptidase SppA [Rikenellaceae bacterium]|nr:signal peptide peptidase SppA [Rikenellaceae bacterium]